MDLSTADLLRVWEEAAGLDPVRRDLRLLTTAWPDTPAAAFARAGIGRRDAYLLALRDELFGAALTGVGACPACGEPLELAFDTADIRAPAPPDGASDDAASSDDDASSDDGAPLEVVVEAYRAQFRLPNGDDLLAIRPARSAAEARRALLDRCVLAVTGPAGETVEPLPAFLEPAIVARMEAADPQANVQLTLDCPACGHGWLQPFDIAAYLWQEIDDWARRTLRETHLLAAAYGWSEAAILGLSSRRRQLYLEMVLA